MRDDNDSVESAKFTRHIMRETTAVKFEDPEEGTNRERG